MSTYTPDSRAHLSLKEYPSRNPSVVPIPFTLWNFTVLRSGANRIPAYRPDDFGVFLFSFGLLLFVVLLSPSLVVVVSVLLAFTGTFSEKPPVVETPGV